MNQGIIYTGTHVSKSHMCVLDIKPFFLSMYPSTSRTPGVVPIHPINTEIQQALWSHNHDTRYDIVMQ